MNKERILKLALDAGLLNYVDNETPRRYFIDGYADLEEVEEFAQLIVRECAGIVTDAVDHREPASTYADKIRQHFGVEE